MLHSTGSTLLQREVPGRSLLHPVVQATPRVSLPAEQLKALTLRIQDAGTEVVKAKVSGLLSSSRFCDRGDRGDWSLAHPAPDLATLETRRQPARLCSAVMVAEAHRGGKTWQTYKKSLLPQAGKGSATLSMAYAAAKFGESCLAAMAGRAGLVECAYVESHLTPLPFFASRVVLGPHGVQVRLLLSCAARHAAAAQLLGMRAPPRHLTEILPFAC